MKNLHTLAAIALASVVLVACHKPPAAAGAAPDPVVSVSAPISETVMDWDDFTGRFEAPEEVEVRARTGGYLQTVNFRDGQMVQRGQLLFTLDDRTAQAALAAAKAQLQLAQSELDRAKTLLDAQAISREDYEARQSAQAVAQATVRARELDVEFTRVTAPVSGLISDRRVDVGNVISGGTSGGDVLTTIVAVNPIHFVFDASEAQLLKYQRQAASRQGAAVQVRLQDESEARWNGRVDFFDNAIDSASGSIRLRASIPNPNGFLKPGMFGAARMAGGGAYPALLIPDTAVVAQGPQKVAFVVNATGVIEARVLQLGPTSEGLRVVRSGLRPDDKVVINGVQRVRPGLKVKAQEAKIERGGTSAPIVSSSAAPSSTATPVR